jgi:hypothetical protein
MCISASVVLKEVLRKHSDVLGNPGKLKSLFEDYLPRYSKNNGEPFFAENVILCRENLHKSFSSSIPKTMEAASRNNKNLTSYQEKKWITDLMSEISINQDDAEHLITTCWEKVFDIIILPDLQKCTKCGHPYTKDEIYCQDCGEQLMTSTICPHCRHQIPGNAKYCPDCGQKI